MAAHTDVIDREATLAALDEEFIKNFNGDFSRLAELVGLFGTTTMTAGTALYQYVVTGQLKNAAIDPGTVVYAKTTDKDVVEGKTYYTESGGTYSAVVSPAKADLGDYYVAYASMGESSGEDYVEGDRIARTRYTLKKEFYDEMPWHPYAIESTAQAILKGGFQNTVFRTDQKAWQQLRALIVDDLMDALAAGTGSAAPESGTWGLQEMLAYGDATLGDTMETNGDPGGSLVHFVNRMDAAAYLAQANITTQEAFGLTYLQSFLGAENVILTNKVQKGTCIVTPVENIHVYGCDYGALGAAGLNYTPSEGGLAGIWHSASHDYASVTTFFVKSMLMIPEVKDYIVVVSANPS